jgi:hypothetical protein
MCNCYLTQVDTTCEEGLILWSTYKGALEIKSKKVEEGANDIEQTIKIAKQCMLNYKQHVKNNQKIN